MNIVTDHFAFHVISAVSCVYRIDNITDFLCITRTYETLGLSRIEGIETYNSRFNLLVNNIKKKSYNPLEHRKKDFDVDYEDFKAQVKDLEVRSDFLNL